MAALLSPGRHARQWYGVATAVCALLVLATAYFTDGFLEISSFTLYILALSLPQGVLVAVLLLVLV